MPLLLTESLDHSRRELTHEHIESCADCTAEWNAYRETWGVLGALPEVEVPARVKDRFLAEVSPATTRDNVVAFPRRPFAKWIAQAAAVVILAGGSYYAGRQNTPARPSIDTKNPMVSSAIQPASYSIAESRVLPASALSPDIQGRPSIHNVQFVDSDPSDNQIGLSFDVSSHVTVNGSPNDR